MEEVAGRVSQYSYKPTQNVFPVDISLLTKFHEFQDSIAV